MDAVLNFGASVLAFGAMCLFGRLSAQRSTYGDGRRDGYREGLEYALKSIKIAQAKEQDEVAN